MTFDKLEDAVFYEMVAVDLLPDCNGIENVFFFFFFIYLFIYSIKKHSPITNIPPQKKKKSTKIIKNLFYYQF